MALRDPNQQYTYTIFGKKVTLPKGFELAPGVSINQNKKSVEEGFKKLKKWLNNPTPQNWNKIFGKNNAFGFQLRNYLLGRTDLGSVKGMPTANKVFDELNVKKLIPASDTNKINELTTGGKGKSLTSISAKTLGNLKYSMAENIETIKNFQNGDNWLRANADPDKIGSDGKNIYRKFANAIRGMEKEAAKIGGFPFGNNSEKKLWSNLYRASYRGDRIKIIGEFADGNLPINADGKIDWKMTNKAGVPAWKRVEFIDSEAPVKNAKFKWNNFKTQVDNVFGLGAFKRISAPYDTQVKTGSKRLTSGNYETIKNKTKVDLLRAELFTQKPGKFKKSQIPTEAEYNKYVNSKARGFNITEVHHPDGVGKNPWKMEPVFRYANREIDKVSQALKAGNIDLAGAKLEIDRINNEVGPIRMKLDDGYYGTKTTTQKATVGAADNYLKGILKTVKGTPGSEVIILKQIKQNIISKATNNEDNVCEVVFGIGKAAGGTVGGGCARQMELAFDEAPDQTLNKISQSKSPKLKSFAQRALSLLPKLGTPGKIAAGAVAGAAAIGALTYNKELGEFVNPLNDDKASQATVTEWIKDNPVKTVAGTSIGFSTQEIPGAYKKARELGRGRTRSALGITGALKPVLTTFGTPAMTALFEAPFAAKRLEEGETMTEVLTDPLGPALGLSLMETLSQKAGVVRDAPKRTMAEGLKNYFNLSNVGTARPGVTSKILRMGMSPRMIAGASRFLGLPGLALSLGLTGYDAYKNYQNEEGMLYNLFNKNE